MPEGWPIFSEWEARKKLPYYGGNNIPDSYLDKFNAVYDAKCQAQPELPSDIFGFVRDL